MRRRLAVSLGIALAATAASAQAPQPWGYAILRGTTVGPFVEWMGDGIAYVPVRDRPGGPIRFLRVDQSRVAVYKDLDAKLLAVSAPIENGQVLVRESKGWRLVDGTTGKTVRELPALASAAPRVRLLSGYPFRYVVGDDQFVVKPDGEVVAPVTKGVVYGGRGGDEALLALPKPDGAHLDFLGMSTKRVLAADWPTKPGDADLRRYVMSENLAPYWDAASGRFGFRGLAAGSPSIAPAFTDVRPFQDGLALVFDSAGGRLRARVIDPRGGVHASFADVRPCGSSVQWKRLALLCLADRVALVDTTGRELARVDGDYAFDPYDPMIGGTIFWLHRAGADGRAQWLGLDTQGARVVDGADAARISEVRSGAGLTYVVRGWASGPEALAAADPAVADRMRADAAAAAHARLVATHGLQPLSEEEQRLAENDPGFYHYRLIRLYVNRHVLGAPSASDYATAVVTVWAQKGHGPRPAAELAATAGCPVGDDRWALAYNDVYVVENVEKEMKDTKKLYKKVLGSEYVQGSFECRQPLFKDTF